MLTKYMKILPTMPFFKTKGDKLAYGYLLTGLAITISGSWFAQIAYFSIIFKKSGLSSPIAVYFFCTYFPLTILAWFWSKIVLGISLKSTLRYSQLLAAALTLLQIITLIKPNLYLFFCVTFLKGLCASVLYLAYDTLIAAHFNHSGDIHRANVLLSAARYGGLIIFPVLGGYCSEVLGDIVAIMVDGLSSFIAFMFFLKISDNYYNTVATAEPQKNDKLKISTGKDIRAFLVPFLNQFSYGIFNYLMPVYLLIHLNIKKHDYGLAMAFSGAAFLLSAQLASSRIISNLDNAALKRVAITSTILNGVFLYVAFTTQEFFQFNVYMFLASAISLISITSIKTLLMGSFSQLGPQRLSARYNTSVWLGMAFGYIFCAVIGNHVSSHLLAICILSILVASSFIVMRNSGFANVEVDHENLVEI